MLISRHRDGEFNVYSYDVGSKKIRRLTTHADFPVLNMSAGAGKIIYEQAGYLHILDPATSGNGRKLAIGVAADLRETRPRFVKGANYIRNASISPSGVRAAFEYRGEIVTVPVEKGDARNLTNTPGANERSPTWSPDGTQIAYISDASGEYELKIAPQDGHGAVKTLKLMGHGFYQDLDWSPDGTRIVFCMFINGQEDIYTANPDGSDVVQVTNTPEVEGGPNWGRKPVTP